MILPELLTKEFISSMLLSDKAWLHRGITAIYEKQTDEEKHAEATLKHNCVGFNATDAYILSSFAKQLLQGRQLSQKQLAIAKKKMPKYSGQLLAIAREKSNGIR